MYHNPLFNSAASVGTPNFRNRAVRFCSPAEAGPECDSHYDALFFALGAVAFTLII